MKVYKNAEDEVGWFPIDLTEGTDANLLCSTLPRRLMAHFRLPSGAERMASSEACVNQAFVYGDRLVGLQFHQ